MLYALANAPCYTPELVEDTTHFLLETWKNQVDTDCKFHSHWLAFMVLEIALCIF